MFIQVRHSSLRFARVRQGSRLQEVQASPRLSQVFSSSVKFSMVIFDSSVFFEALSGCPRFSDGL